jgi:hypothetical protein
MSTTWKVLTVNRRLYTICDRDLRFVIEARARYRTADDGQNLAAGPRRGGPGLPAIIRPTPPARAAAEEPFASARVSRVAVPIGS